jgi:hypothetical protein
MRIFTILLLSIFYQLSAQNFYGRWYLLDFMKARTGVIHGTFFSKDSVKHFITDPFLSGTYLEDYKYPYTSFKHQNYEIICQRDGNVIYVIILKFINYNKSEIYVPSKYFYSIEEVRSYIHQQNFMNEPFIPIYSESYLRTFSQLKPFHTISNKEFEKVMLNAFKLFDDFAKNYKNPKQVKARVLINLFICQSLLRMGYSPFAVSFPERLIEGENMSKLSDQLDAYTKKW